MLGVVDRIIGNRFGLAKEFEKGFMLLGNMALSMMGMIVISPLIADLLEPLFSVFSNVLHLDPSIIPACFFAIDMGGAPLSVEVAANPELGMFNAMVVSTMMGATVSFSIPYALERTAPENHKELLLGFLCGIVTIPVGCFVSGLIVGLPVGLLLLNMLPLVILSGIIVCGLVFCPSICIKIFGAFGTFIKILITIGLALGVIEFLTDIEIVKGLTPIEEATEVCLNTSIVMSGAFPFMYIVSKLVSKPMKKLGNKIGVNESSALGFVATIATSMTTFEFINDMDKKGIVLNSAFAVSAAFTLAGHLAFTLAFNADYILPMMVGKIISGFAGLFLAAVIYNGYGLSKR